MIAFTFALAFTTYAQPEIVVSPTGPAWRVLSGGRVNDACIHRDGYETQFVKRGSSCKSLPIVAGTAVHDRFPWARYW